MTLNKEHVSPHSTYPVTQLHESDVHTIATIMREAYPSFWGDVTEQRILQNMPNFQWIGIKHPHLSSVCSYRFTDWIDWVSIVTTGPTHRNQGRATAILLYAVTDLLT